ncbi:unnamed protein product [Natator depressus]
MPHTHQGADRCPRTRLLRRKRFRKEMTRKQSLVQNAQKWGLKRVVMLLILKWKIITRAGATTSSSSCCPLCDAAPGLEPALVSAPASTSPPPEILLPRHRARNETGRAEPGRDTPEGGAFPLTDNSTQLVRGGGWMTLRYSALDAAGREFQGSLVLMEIIFDDTSERTSQCM